MENKIYDVIVIGGGPAGYTAALYATRAGLDTVVLEKFSAGGQMTQTQLIDNYPGFDEGVDGFTLGDKMKSCAEKFGAVTVQTEVLAVDLHASPKQVTADVGEFYGKTVIVATGADHKHLGIADEEKLLGRGLAYPIALEGALKILETNKMKVKGYTISDFYHGPVAQLHEGDLAIVLAQSGVMLPDGIKMLKKLDTVKANSVIITDDKELANSENAIYIESTGSEYSLMFLMALTVQLIALKLVIAKGIDPDKSDAIAKITVTK